jgi:ABC-type nitrate/sulfonate/bicarbonate transport system ATPase subunit
LSNRSNVAPAAGDPAPLALEVTRKAARTAAGLEAEIIAGLKFSLRAGETAALIGPSGCGKSTLMRILAGLDDDFEGSVRRPPGTRIGMAFQEPRLLPWRSVEDNVRIAAPQSRAEERAALFAALGLDGHRAHYPGELSLGLARRASLARALAAKPGLLLLDEPFVSLDPPLARAIRADLARLIEAQRLSVVLVTHDVEDALDLADAIYVLSPRPAQILGRVRIETPRFALSPNGRAALAREVERLRASAAPS